MRPSRPVLTDQQSPWEGPRSARASALPGARAGRPIRATSHRGARTNLIEATTQHALGNAKNVQASFRGANNGVYNLEGKTRSVFTALVHRVNTKRGLFFDYFWFGHCSVDCIFPWPVAKRESRSLSERPFLGIAIGRPLPFMCFKEGSA